MVDATAISAPLRLESEVRDHLSTGGPALVALSGGVDSSLVAALAVEALGTEAVAVTLTGPAVARAEVDRARRVAEFLGIRHEVLEVDPLARSEYRANPTNRCYFCRSIESKALRAYGDPRGVRQYLDGIHVDDLAEYRPGIRAMDEAGFSHPLAWAGWRKADVRAAARSRDLPNWDQPSDACLASRVAHGEPISRDLLARVEAAEKFLHARGFRRVRVRTQGTAARVEVDPDDVARLASRAHAHDTVAYLRTLGFNPVTIDPDGYGANRRGGRASP